MSSQNTEVILGIDAGGTKVSCGMVRTDGRILKAERFPVPRHRLDLLFFSCCGILDRLAASCRADGLKPLGIGIAMRGLIDAENSRLISSTLFRDAGTFDLCARLSEKYGLPVCMDNDVHAAALAEMQWGAGRKAGCLTYINVGTGLAVGIIDHGRLLRGCSNTGGELGGSLFLRADGGEKCTLEDIVSGYGMQREVRRLLPLFPDSVLVKAAADGKDGDTRAIFDAAKAGDALADRVITQAAGALAEAIINMEYIVNSGLYVLGGGIMNQQLFFERLQQQLADIQKQMKISVAVRLQLSSLGADDAGLLGAASLILQTKI